MLKYKFCPQCKYSLKKKDNSYCCQKCKISIYINPKPCVGVLLIKNGKVLLTKRAIEPYKGLYDTIGGFVKNGETPEEASIRETKEETGLDIKLIDIIGFYADRYGEGGDHITPIAYVAKITGGKLKSQDDVASLHWFQIDKPPKMAFKSEDKMLKDLWKWYKKNKLRLW